ncbi:hypothetical protein RYA99_12230 [Pseudomonas syringae pv. actinidifoliorum]|nr:hypothetical protein [Pseudomonas syringae pv. actinidifoliorum]MDU8520078.1 hypothetical protein [Pseudomonas syringae pv. actinidifoliorum]MDU8526945.1 hypothetical protein [Pseudomonas syringae pv. actinidifoliorum]
MSNEYTLVPARILLDKNVIGVINFHCGDGDGQFGDYVDGELWVGRSPTTIERKFTAFIF